MLRHEMPTDYPEVYGVVLYSLRIVFLLGISVALSKDYQVPKYLYVPIVVGAWLDRSMAPSLEYLI